MLFLFIKYSTIIHFSHIMCASVLITVSLTVNKDLEALLLVIHNLYVFSVASICSTEGPQNLDVSLGQMTGL